MFHYSLERTVLISGASRGIGAAIASCLANLGFYVVGTATTEKGAAIISKSLATAPQPGLGVVLDLKSATTVQQCLDNLVTKIATTPTILIHNAGINSDKLLLRMNEADWQNVIDVNLTGAFRLAKYVIPAMVKAKFGRIVLLSSVIAAQGNAGQTNYAASKAGLTGFAKSLAQEVASRNITVNVVAPGFVQTEMTEKLPSTLQDEIKKRIPLRRVAVPEEIAAAVAYLISNEAGYVTGETLHINGGLYMN